jgi:hypothetical protein
MLATDIAAFTSRDVAAPLQHAAELLEQRPADEVREQLELVAAGCEELGARANAPGLARAWKEAAEVLRSVPPAVPEPPPRSRIEELQQERAQYADLLQRANEEAGLLREAMLRVCAERKLYARLVRDAAEEMDARSRVN